MTARVAPLLFVVLLLIGVPWYWPNDDTTTWFGAPAWVCMAVAVSTAASILVAVLMARPWPGEGENSDD